LFVLIFILDLFFFISLTKERPRDV